MTAPAIRLQNVSKSFRVHRQRPNSLKEVFVQRAVADKQLLWALRDVDLEVEPGTTFGLIGANGSGKSTLLRVMASIYKPTSGKVQSLGRVAALIELGAGFHPDLTGRENVYLTASMLGFGRRQTRSVIDQIIDFSGIEGFVDTPVKHYSSGMYMRLGFSVMVNLEPDVLLVDEVLAVGDDAFQRRCLRHIEMLQRGGVTIVFVSHSLALIHSMCSRVGWLDQGHLKVADEPSVAIAAYLGHLQTRAAPDRSESAPQDSASPIRIESVSVLGTNDHPVHFVGCGDPVTIRIHYRCTREVQDPVFGLAMHTEEGLHVAGPNTQLAQTPTGAVSGTGYLDYRISRLSLLPGIYVLTAAIFDRQLLESYSIEDRAFRLHVEQGSSSEQYGIVDLQGTWSVPTITS